ncbi:MULTISPECIES: flavin-containing monooxygenase [Mycobacteriaceae]|uniref:FAD-containing monooxygenase EthA n=1 Tax=Mycolicibacterium neoaurum VKM Ac-1815D TaxID=700508 RepID=V5XHV8_MYCNE|nr:MULTISPECIES: NAD(P)/FAD-dependent oxidoreductase [Mycobacteriaceae]AHC27433.1 FAD-containing monooxygenase EthA [Mycolicibacterium neoaurum VKM Ac-1815D]AMO07645.1 FAD-containing monooxygenase EthA [Mycolicibacterium neoaurum]AXK73967.1 NAD(P)/FAD-dependent oxidoreductase [Mycolicibacterium neoaurum]KJQ51598.1 FAD-containing monooxygenase EthA [Mycolicibacterium neoaurum]KUM08824.1 FAD-containing monooxygenase EthA [Mycolicibacterium neoaurum]
MNNGVHEHVDVVVIGAGIAGISAAWHIRRHCPDLSVAVLEGRSELGGTWSLFRYPGVRCDSDMYTLGFTFAPWTEQDAIVGGDVILAYLKRVVDQEKLTPFIRLGHQVHAARWSSRQKRWSIQVTGSSGNREMTCSFLLACTGYYRYDGGYLPDFPGIDDFEGVVVHPQQWPQELSVEDRRVAVIGSGATAMTLAPTLATKAAHVTMVQRSPTYVVSRPRRDRVANLLLRNLPRPAAYSLIRAKNISMMMLSLYMARKVPARMGEAIIDRAKRELPAGYDAETHFRPRYKIWDNRLCLILDGDLFTSIRRGELSMATGQVERFDKDGLMLGNGEHVPADVVVMATGFHMRLFGGIDLYVDDEQINLADTVCYKGMMLHGVPNFAFTVGYQAATYTLKADIVSRYVSRLLNYMRDHHIHCVTPNLDDESVHLVPFTEYRPGYVERVLDSLPRQGSKPPWRLSMNYYRDSWMSRVQPIADDHLTMS